MKKTYVNPELVVIALNLSDILTESVEKEQDLWMPGGADKDWSTYVNVK